MRAGDAEHGVVDAVVCRRAHCAIQVLLNAGPRSPQTDLPGGSVILLALLLPVVMTAFLLAADALEDLFFPPAVLDEAAPAVAGADPSHPHGVL